VDEKIHFSPTPCTALRGKGAALKIYIIKT
jgi:hypothetical protein